MDGVDEFYLFRRDSRKANLRDCAEEILERLSVHRYREHRRSFLRSRIYDTLM